jgi:hypothetical protein
MNILELLHAMIGYDTFCVGRVGAHEHLDGSPASRSGTGQLMLVSRYIREFLGQK